MTQVKEKMTKQVTCALPNDSLEDIYTLMTELNVRHLPVIEGRRLLGMISDRDVLLRAQVIDGKIELPAGYKATDVMSKTVVACVDGLSVGEAARKMVDLKIDSLPVTDKEGNLKGLVTTSDLLKLVKDSDSPILSEEVAIEFELRTSKEQLNRL